MDPFRCGISRTSVFAFVLDMLLTEARNLNYQVTLLSYYIPTRYLRTALEYLNVCNPHPSYFPSDDTVTTGFFYTKKRKSLAFLVPPKCF